MIKARWAILAVCVLLSARAQSVPAQKAEDEIFALDKMWVTAEVEHDRETLERILDEALVVTGSSGTTVGRKEFIDRLLSRPASPFEVVHELVRIHGETAVVVDRFGEGLKMKSTWVAVKKNGQWRVVAEHFTSIRQQ